MEQQNPYTKSGLYSPQQNVAHKRQSSSLHGHFNHNKNLGIPEVGQKEGLYGQAPDLPPRIDRAVKPMGLLTTTNKIPNGRSAHERLFGTKPPESTESSSDVPQFSGKLGSLERSQNSKSVSYLYKKKQRNQIEFFRIPFLVTTLSIIVTTTLKNNLVSSLMHMTI